MKETNPYDRIEAWQKKSTELKSINLKYFSIQYIFRRKFNFKIWIIIFDTRTMCHANIVTCLKCKT